LGKSPNVAAVRALVDDAEPVPELYRGDPEPGQPLMVAGEAVNPGKWVPDELGLPPHCPVVPLGVDDKVNWFLDPIGQLYAYQKPYGQADTLELFRGRHKYLYWAWPKWTMKGKGEDVEFIVDAWRNEKVREAVLAACAAKGPWNAVDKVRGRGTWQSPSGELVIHCGRHVMQRGKKIPPHEIEGYVYPTRPTIPGPWPQPVRQEENPAKLLRPLLRSWNWVRPDVDPHLFFGALGVGFLGGALAWRSNIYITGDAGMGKSTLLALYKAIYGDWALDTANTTAAGIYQHVKQDSTPVWVDEFEGKADNNKALAILELARQASSGARGLRGGDRGTGSEFSIASAFVFSSINPPPLRPQDLSRFALLQLRALPRDAPPPDINPGVLGVVGRCILRRLVDEWPRFHQTFQAFRGELARAGMDARGQDTFGTLLTCADLIEFEGWDEARLRTPVDGDLVPWAQVLRTEGMIEFEDRTANWRGCLNHLLSVPVDAWRNGTRSVVGQVLEDWMGKHDDFGSDIKAVRKVLSQAGLGLQREVGKHAGDWLAIPNQNPLTRRLFEGSDWAGIVGTSVWSGALRQAPETISRPGQCKVNGVKARCTLVSLEALYGPDGIMTQDEDVTTVNAPRPDPMISKESP